MRHVARIAGLLILWAAIGMMVMDAGLFIPADWYETVVAVAALQVAAFCSVVIWLGADLVALFRERNSDDFSQQH